MRKPVRKTILSKIRKAKSRCRNKCYRNGNNYLFTCSCGKKGKYPSGWHIDSPVPIDKNGNAEWKENECFGCGKNSHCSCECIKR